MLDYIQSLEDAAERQYEDMLQPNGLLECVCGKQFDPDHEGGTVSANPYAMPVCGECLDTALANNEQE